jgi:hypothetical protein
MDENPYKSPVASFAAPRRSTGLGLAASAMGTPVLGMSACVGLLFYIAGQPPSVILTCIFIGMVVGGFIGGGVYLAPTDRKLPKK